MPFNLSRKDMIHVVWSLVDVIEVGANSQAFNYRLEPAGLDGGRIY